MASIIPAWLRITLLLRRRYLVSTYLLAGDKDLLFPFQKSIDNAKKHIKTLKEVKVFNNVGHGIETYDKALNYIGAIIKNYRQ